MESRRWDVLTARLSIGRAEHLLATRTYSPGQCVATLAQHGCNLFLLLPALRHTLHATNSLWISNFLAEDGLCVLFEVLTKLTEEKPSLTRLVSQQECVRCIRLVMDSQSGLDYIIENAEFTDKFAKALDTDNVPVKKHVVELLSAMCVFSAEGYQRSVQVVEHYAASKKKRYRFSVLVDELRRSDNLVYRAALLGFINCIIIYTKDVSERIRIRDEFLGLKFQEVLNALRKHESDDPDLTVQLYVFDSYKSDDEEQLPADKSLDLNNALDLFHAVYKQICDTPLEVKFLAVLRHMLQIDSSAVISDVIWQTLERLVHKATLIEKVDDSHKLLTAINRRIDNATELPRGSAATGGETKCDCCCHKRRPRSVGSTPTSPDGPESKSHIEPMQATKTQQGSPEPPSIPPPPPAPGPPPPPPPLPGAPALRPAQLQIKLPQQNIPKPKLKMRTLQWQKIPVNSVVQGKGNVWMVASNNFSGYAMDYSVMDELFSLKCQSLEDKTTNDNVVNNNNSKKRRDSIEINLLDAKRSLMINVFLKQFKLSNEEITANLKEGNNELFHAERLKGLLRILPSKEEIEVLTAYDGDKTKLGSAERFLLQLLDLPHYQLIIEAQLLKEEFMVEMEWIVPALDAVIEASKEIRENKELHEILYLVLIAGNYLNSGNFAGDAAGFKMNSLLKLTEIRANKPRMNLLHYVCMEAEQKRPSLLKVAEKFKFLKDASLLSVESLVADVSELNKRLNRIEKQCSVVGLNLNADVTNFLIYGKNECYELTQDISDIERLKNELSDFFCEDPKTFKLEDCIKTVFTFCEKFTKAAQENIERSIREDNQRLKDKNKRNEERSRVGASESGQQNAEQKSDEDEDGENEDSIVDMLLADVRSGFPSKGLEKSQQFTVTKVKKVNLSKQNSDPSKQKEDNFVRGGVGRVSVRKKKTSGNDNNNSSSGGVLISENGDNTSISDSTPVKCVAGDEALVDVLLQTPDHPDGHLDSFRRNVNNSNRRRRSERRAGKGYLAAGTLERERAPSPTVGLDHKRAEVSKNVENIPDQTHLRRTKSFMDHKDIEKAIANGQIPNDVAAQDSVYDRVKRRLERRAQKNTADVNAADKPNDSATNKNRNLQEDKTRINTNAQWRSNIPDTNNLQTIDEKYKCQESEESSHNTRVNFMELNDCNVSQTYGQSSDKGGSENCGSRDDTRSPKVSVSVKAKLNKRWNSELGKSDIDQVLKAIEDAGKQIDNMHVAEKLLETRKADNLSIKRNKRKLRSQLSIDDVHKALAVPESNDDMDSVESNEILVSSNDNTNECRSGKKDIYSGRQKFRAHRFGEDNHPDSRCKSNVEKEEVEQAYKVLLRQSSMNRSKSCGDAVADKEVKADNKLLIKDNSNPEIGQNSPRIKKLSSGKSSLTNDKRRHGRYIPGVDSDSDTPVTTTERRRKSSTKSDSRSSMWSGTSTETLQQDNASEKCDSTPEQTRKNSAASETSQMNNDGSSYCGGLQHDEKVEARKRIELQSAALDDESPSASMARWRLRRLGSKSANLSNNVVADNNVTERSRSKTDSRLDPAFNSPVNHMSTLQRLEYDLQTDPGSRGSFASDRDEGFESQSGTASQRTSLCSGPDDTILTPLFPRKDYESLLNVDVNTNVANNLLNASLDGDNRTDRWARQTALTNTDDKDSLLDSSLDYSMISDPSRDDQWSPPVQCPTSPKHELGVILEPEVTEVCDKSPAPTGSPKRVPGYMRGTSSSSSRIGLKSSFQPVRTSSMRKSTPISSPTVTKDLSTPTKNRKSIPGSLLNKNDSTHSLSSGSSDIKITPKSVGRSSMRVKSAGSQRSMNTESPLRRIQSVRVKPTHETAADRAQTAKALSKVPGFMAPTTSSRYKNDSDQLATPTKSPVKKTNSPPSSLRRHSSLRVNSQSDNKTGVPSVDKPKTKSKATTQKNEVTSPKGRKGASDAEVDVEKSKDGDKGSSFFNKISFNKTKDRHSIRKSDSIKL